MVSSKDAKDVGMIQAHAAKMSEMPGKMMRKGDSKKWMGYDSDKSVNKKMEIAFGFFVVIWLLLVILMVVTIILIIKKIRVKYPV